jgi:nicotinate dehydrogenase subunit B
MTTSVVLASPSLAQHPHADAWLRVREDNHIEVRTGKVELGQGISAALRQTACRCLGVLPEHVHLIAGDTALSPDEGYTAGSQSVEVGVTALEHVCRMVQRAFAAAAAQSFGVAVTHVQLHAGCFVTAGTTSATAPLTYAALRDAVDLAQIAVNTEPLPAAPHESQAPQVLRDDFAAKFTGNGFIHDLRLPHMLHARMVRGPHPLAKAKAVPHDWLSELDGVLEVFHHGDFLALLGEDEGALDAAQAKAVAHIGWHLPDLPAHADAQAVLLNAAAQSSTPVDQTSDATNTPTAITLKRRYSRPYLAHASIGPACALAQPASESEPLTVWSHSQGVFKLRDQIAMALGLSADEVRVIHTPGAGCYGHNGADDVAFDAALIAHQRGLPVRVQWSRREELSQSPMGSASVVDLQAELDADANLLRWQADVWSHTHLARPGWGPGVQLLGAWSLPHAAARPADLDVPLPTGGGLRNVIPEYRLPALRVNHHFVPQAPVRMSALRSLGAHANVFAIESFIDELCEAAGVDALQFRLRHLDDPRARAVLQRVGELCDWSQRLPGGSGTGLGLGYARYKNRAGYCAIAMQVEVAEIVQVQKVWACVDAGRIIHRDGLLNQIEGGVIQALSWSLKESVQWDAGGITSDSWETYPILSFQEVPEIETDLIDRPDVPSLGSGEVVTGPCAAALGNAIAHALGLRVRDLPFTPERLLQAIHQTSEETT